MRWMALLLVGVALAGCAADTDPVIDEEEPLPDEPWLRFLEPVDLGSKAGPMGLGLGGFGTNCQDSLDDGDCGLGEPSVEVDGAGTIYVTGVCCLTTAPPVYVSRDGGQTFQTLDTPGIREAFGIEGDFAVDAMGRIYYADIEFAGTFQVTVWDADGNYLRHTKWPAPPLVDRDWIRAEGDGTAYYVYNTGAMGTRVYKSVDAGMTWSPDAIHVVPYALGNVAIDPGVELCLFGGNVGGFRSMDCSRDGGATWSNSASSMPRGADAYPVGAYDEAGNLWLAETQNVPGGQEIWVTWRDADGTWHAPYAISPNGTHRMPWLAAGADGGVAVAWYGVEEGGSDWFLHVGATTDGFAGNTSWAVMVADPTPVFQGNLGRDLLDFLQTDIGPEGTIHVAYSRLPGTPGQDGNEEQLIYVRSAPVAGLAMKDFWLGP